MNDKTRARRPSGVSALTLAFVALAAAGCGDDDGPAVNERPAWLGGVTQRDYDGTSDDLLTAGLGAAGLQSATPPSIADPAAPTAVELRRLAIHSNYRAIVDTTPAGGYGTVYGPTVDAPADVLARDGRIAGTEYTAYSDDGTGRQNVTLVVQVPAGFDPARPCVLAAASSGSRGVYGAVSTGEWGLKRGCAVAYTDKGTGAAPHDLQADTVPLIDGTRAASAAAGNAAHFRAPLTGAELAAFNTATPHRFAFKHAHSQRNPEKDWGRFTLQAAEFALWALNERFGAALPDGRRERRFDAGNTLVIASSISNGGGAALAAAEQDTAGLIDAVAVSEPAVEMPAAPGVTVRRGAQDVAVTGRTLIDFTTYANLYQVCASLSPALAAAPGRAFLAPVNAQAAARCQSMADKGLLPGLGAGSTTVQQAEAALAALRGYGWEPESDALHPSHAAFEIASAVSVTFANALARASVADRLCGYGFAATSAALDATFGRPVPLAAAAIPPMYATGNGIPPTGGIQLVNEDNPGGPLRDLFSVSASTGRADMNLDGATCLRGLLVGTDSKARALQAGLDETRRNGNLGRKPTVIVHGRADALLPVNHTSRPYVALNRRVEGDASRLSYIEVTNAQHFDAFIPLLAGYDTRYVPLHAYLFRALDAVWANQRDGRPLPPSQVVRTVPRGGTPGAAPALSAVNLPPIASDPAAGDRIAVSGATIAVPD